MHPSIAADQRGAAERDAAATYRRLAHRMGGVAASRGHDQVPQWLSDALNGAWTGYATGTSATCTHNPSAYRPQPVYAATRTPGLIVCEDCLHLLGSTVNTCDGCGHECDTNNPIYVTVARAGALIVRIAVCIECRIDMERPH